MSGWHKRDALGGPVFDRLREFLRSRDDEEAGTGDFEDFERELHRLLSEVEADLVGAELQRLDIDVAQIEVDGETYRRVGSSESTYQTAAGPIGVNRHLYRANGERRAICPLEMRAGIVEGEYTPRAARLMALVMSEMPSATGETLFDEFGGMTPSRSALDRLPKRLSEHWEENRLDWESLIRGAESVPKAAVACAVSLDGVMVPMKSREAHDRREAEGKQTKGPADYREASVATVSFYDWEGERLETRRIARMPEPGKLTTKQWLQDEWESIRRQQPELQLVRMSDGAADHWTALSQLESYEVVDIEDFFHACEHLKEAADALFGEGSEEGKRFFETNRQRLRDEENGVEAVIRALAYRTKTRRKGRAKAAKVLAYFRKRRHRMQYAAARAQNLPIGTGVTEAACKTLVSARLKKAGMRWRMEGGQAIVTLRSLLQSDRWDRGWNLIKSAYVKEVRIAA